MRATTTLSVQGEKQLPQHPSWILVDPVNNIKEKQTKYATLQNVETLSSTPSSSAMSDFQLNALYASNIPSSLSLHIHFKRQDEDALNQLHSRVFKTNQHVDDIVYPSLEEIQQAAAPNLQAVQALIDRLQQVLQQKLSHKFVTEQTPHHMDSTSETSSKLNIQPQFREMLSISSLATRLSLRLSVEDFQQLFDHEPIHLYRSAAAAAATDAQRYFCMVHLTQEELLSHLFPPSSSQPSLSFTPSSVITHLNGLNKFPMEWKKKSRATQDLSHLVQALKKKTKKKSAHSHAAQAASSSDPLAAHVQEGEMIYTQQDVSSSSSSSSTLHPHQIGSGAGTALPVQGFGFDSSFAFYYGLICPAGYGAGGKPVEVFNMRGEKTLRCSAPGNVFAELVNVKVIIGSTSVSSNVNSQTASIDSATVVSRHNPAYEVRQPASYFTRLEIGGFLGVQNNVTIINHLPYSVSFSATWTIPAFPNRQVAPVDAIYPFYLTASQWMTPSFVKQWYQVPDRPITSSTSSTARPRGVAIAALDLGSNDSRGYYSPSDLSSFLVQKAGLSAATFGSFVPLFMNTSMVKPTIGTNDPSRPDIETQLDIQWATAMYLTSLNTSLSTLFPVVNSLTLPISILHADGYTPFEDILNYLMGLSSAASLPAVLSVSYGQDENDLFLDEFKQLNMLFQSVSLRGVSVLIASGDNGAFSTRAVSPCAYFTPDYPSTSPYVLAVGATMLFKETSNLCPREVTASIERGAIITSGGGYSSLFQRGSYQDAVGNEFEGATSPPLNNAVYRAAVGRCSSLNDLVISQSHGLRMYPDISVFGHNYGIMHMGRYISVDGTSASAPALAGMLAALNEYRRAQDKGPFGFINPTLYAAFYNDQARGGWNANATLFNDIIEGSNRCLSYVCCTTAYLACRGYDPVTGLGTPNMYNLWDTLVGRGFDRGATAPTFTWPSCNNTYAPSLPPLNPWVGYVAVYTAPAVTTVQRASGDNSTAVDNGAALSNSGRNAIILIILILFGLIVISIYVYQRQKRRQREQALQEAARRAPFQPPASLLGPVVADAAIAAPAQVQLQPIALAGVAPVDPSGSTAVPAPLADLDLPASSAAAGAGVGVGVGVGAGAAYRATTVGAATAGEAYEPYPAKVAAPMPSSPANASSSSSARPIVYQAEVPGGAFVPSGGHYDAGYSLEASRPSYASQYQPNIPTTTTTNGDMPPPPYQPTGY